MSNKRVGAEALEAKGWLGTYKWLLLQRSAQISFLSLFLLGPLAGIWIVKGNLAYSYTLGILPLTETNKSVAASRSSFGDATSSSTLPNTGMVLFLSATP